MKKLIILFLIICINLNAQYIKKQNVNIHSHIHTHVQASAHVHEHHHFDNNSKLFYKEQSFKLMKNSLKTCFFETKETKLEVIKQSIYKPPIS